MRLLIVTQYFWPEDFRINDVVGELVSRGHYVTVLTGLPNYPSGCFAIGYGWRGPYRETILAAEVKRAPLWRRRQGTPLHLALNYASFAISASILGAIRCRKHYDAIFVFAPSPLTVGIPARIISWFTGAPVLFWVQDLWPETLVDGGFVRSRRMLRTIERLAYWIYKGCDRVLVQSEAYIDRIARLGVSRKKICFLPNSAEEFYRPMEASPNWSGPPLPHGFRIMFAGNIGVAQSVATIIAAAKHLQQHKSIHWVILGDGRRYEWLQSEIDRMDLGACVHLYGRHPVVEMPKWFAQADVLLATLRRDAAFALTIPSKLQSYMACGKPILAAIDGEGANIIRKSGSGIAVPAEDAISLADAALSLFHMSKAERSVFGENGLAYFRAEFSRDVQVSRIEAWCHAAAAGDRA